MSFSKYFILSSELPQSPFFLKSNYFTVGEHHSEILVSSSAGVSWVRTCCSTLRCSAWNSPATHLMTCSQPGPELSKFTSNTPSSRKFTRMEALNNILHKSSKIRICHLAPVFSHLQMVKCHSGNCELVDRCSRWRQPALRLIQLGICFPFRFLVLWLFATLNISTYKFFHLKKKVSPGFSVTVLSPRSTGNGLALEEHRELKWLTPASRAIVIFVLSDQVRPLVMYSGTSRVDIKKAHTQKGSLPHYL